MLLGFSLADGGGVPPARDVADLQLPAFGEEHPPEDKGEKEGGVVPSGSGAKSVTPFILGESLPPIPAKLVAKIQKGKFVDMAELLRDNIEADRRRTKTVVQAGPQRLKVGGRSRTSLAGFNVLVRMPASLLLCNWEKHSNS